MKCKKYKKLISKYFDGVLQESEKEIVLSHITQCVDCKIEFDILSKVYNNLPEYKDVELSPNFEKKIFSKIEEEQENKNFVIWRKFVPTIGLFAVLVIILLTKIHPCKSVDLYKEGYIFYPQEDIDFIELEIISFLSELL